MPDEFSNNAAASVPMLEDNSPERELTTEERVRFADAADTKTVSEWASGILERSCTIDGLYTEREIGRLTKVMKSIGREATEEEVAKFKSDIEKVNAGRSVPPAQNLDIDYSEAKKDLDVRLYSGVGAVARAGDGARVMIDVQALTPSARRFTVSGNYAPNSETFSHTIDVDLDGVTDLSTVEQSIHRAIVDVLSAP